MKHQHPFIGKLIQEKIEERKMSIVDFAKAIHCSRPNVYNILKSPSIDFVRLMKISEVLEYDFFAYYSKTKIQPECYKTCFNITYENHQWCIQKSEKI